MNTPPQRDQLSSLALYEGAVTEVFYQAPLPYCEATHQNLKVP